MKPIITPLIEITQQLQIFHWQTKSYSEHKAFEKAYKALQELVDSYIESLFGRTDRVMANEQFTVVLQNYTEQNVQVYLEDALRYLQYDLPVSINDKSATELANIRDEMVQSITALKYLLTLK